MNLKPLDQYPKRDLTPEHTKRVPPNTDIAAAYQYITTVLDTSDYQPPGYAWHGWALREAFLAGISYAQEQRKELK